MRIQAHRATGAVRQRLLDLGLMPNCLVTVVRSAPLNDPIEVRLDAASVTLRRREAATIEVVLAPPDPASDPAPDPAPDPARAPPAPTPPSAPAARTLNDIRPGGRVRIKAHRARGAVRQRLLDLGLMPNVELIVVRSAPLNDPIEVRLDAATVTLRRREAATIEVYDDA